MDHTIQEVVDALLSAVPGTPFPDTVDTFKTGDPAQKVTGIVTTFMANYRTIQKTVELGANLIITHEPTFYNHRDETAWLEDDPVYQAKRRLLDAHGIVIWRFHDYWHAAPCGPENQTDGVLAGVIQALGWENWVDPQRRDLFNLPSLTVIELVQLLKTRLGIQTLRIVGDPDMVCRKAAFLVGAWGGTNHILTLSHTAVDVLIAGEIAEWETSEYVRDAVAIGQKQALIVTGHQPSEEPGMAYLVGWLHQRFPDIPTTHVPAESPFRYI